MLTSYEVVLYIYSILLLHDRRPNYRAETQLVKVP